MSVSLGERTVPLENMTTVELTIWLQSKGFGANVQSAFEGTASPHTVSLQIALTGMQAFSINLLVNNIIYRG